MVFRHWTAHRPALWLIAFVIGTGAAAAAQAVVSVEEFSRAMKTIGTAIDAVNQSIGSKSYAEAKTPLALSRQVLASTRPWWAAHQNADGVTLNRQAVARLDALDKVLSAKTVDPSAVAAAVDDAARACSACHVKYREGDPQAGYRIKGGTP
jgi:hypothetical protein